MILRNPDQYSLIMKARKDYDVQYSAIYKWFYRLGTTSTKSVLFSICKQSLFSKANLCFYAYAHDQNKSRCFVKIIQEVSMFNMKLLLFMGEIWATFPFAVLVVSFEKIVDCISKSCDKWAVELFQQLTPSSSFPLESFKCDQIVADSKGRLRATIFKSADTVLFRWRYKMCCVSWFQDGRSQSRSRRLKFSLDS